ncbi:MAG: ABC transporter permease subunit, partial [Anaerolineae bacterium]
MNIYWREIRANALSLLWWSLGLIFTVGAGMAKYAGFVSAGESINTFFNNLPPMVQAMAGSRHFDLSKASGFYGVMFMYIALLAAIHATMLGATILAKEERDHTSEFLFVKPVSRSKIITDKLLAAFTLIVVYNLIAYGSSLLFLNAFGQGEDASVYVRTLMAGLFIIQLLFLAFGAASSAVVRKPAAAAGLASAIMLGT